MAVGCWRHFTINLVDCLGIVADGPDGGTGLCLFRHANFGSIVTNPQNGERQRVRLDQIGPFQQDGFPRHRRHVAPCAGLETLPRGRHRRFDVGFRAAWNGGEGATVNGRDHIQHVLGSARLPLAVDHHSLRRNVGCPNPVDICLKHRLFPT